MRVDWKEVDGQMKPFAGDREIAWAAQEGAQSAFLSCPVYEVLLEGSRGGGKTDSLIMDFAQHTGQGFRSQWKGVLFRQTYPQLADVISKTKQWFPRMFPRAKFNESQSRWVFPDGEELLLRHMDNEQDYWGFHGWSIPWIGWEELTTWPNDRCYKMMMSCSRSTVPNMPRKVRATTNPYGCGHNWVKSRFRLPVPPRKIIGPIIQENDENGVPMPSRVAIHSMLHENKVMLSADPFYMNKIREAAPNPAALKAWLEGDWNIVAGGMFDDVWVPGHHVVPDIRADLIPPGWKIDRSYDHGQSRPFSVGWWAQSNGEPIQIGGRQYGTIRGDVFRIGEWYGWTGSPNEGVRLTAVEIAAGIKERELRMGIRGRCKPGPADTSIYDDYEPGKSVAGDMSRCGVHWTKADKTSGSRKQGWQQMRQYMKDAIPPAGGMRERPGLFVCESCHHFIRTVPTLPREEKDMDDVDSDSEDHVGDESRYRLRSKNMASTSHRWK